MMVGIAVVVYALLIVMRIVGRHVEVSRVGLELDDMAQSGIRFIGLKWDDPSQSGT
jgi:hypothetical protein